MTATEILSMIAGVIIYILLVSWINFDFTWLYELSSQHESVNLHKRIFALPIGLLIGCMILIILKGD